MHQLELTWGAASHPGLRSENQDRCLVDQPVFAVADGMGGHAAGGEASAAVIARLAAAAVGSTVEISALQTALQQAHDDIRTMGRAQDPDHGAGTTVAGLAVIENGGGLYWAAFHVGDSRIYRWSAGGWERISSDHSVVQELVDSGVITEEQALTHPQRHVITRAVGFGAGVEADYTLLPVDVGQRFLICSDGLTGELSDQRLAHLMAGDTTAHVIAEGLVSEAIERGAQDNVSAVVVHVHGGGAAEGVHGADSDSLEEVTIPRLPSAPVEAATGRHP